MTIDKDLWIALENLDEVITKLLALRDVLTIHELPRNVLVEIISSYVDEFSEKHRLVYQEIRKVYGESRPLDSLFEQSLTKLEIEND